MFALKTKKEKIFESKERLEIKLQSIDIQQLIFLAIALIYKQKKHNKPITSTYLLN